MGWITFGQLHHRLRRAQLPGYNLIPCEGEDMFELTIYGHNGEQFESRSHSGSVLLKWFDAMLCGLQA